MIANAVNWVLNVPFSRISQPVLSDAKNVQLVELIDFLHEVINRSDDVILEEDCFISRAGRLTLDSDLLRTMSECFAYFSDEVGHSSEEILAITGLHSEVLNSLRLRLLMV